LTAREKMIDGNPALERIIHKLLGSKLILFYKLGKLSSSSIFIVFFSVNIADAVFNPRAAGNRKKTWPADLGTDGGQERVTSKRSITS
jgi:hypothetical protein